MDEEDGVDCFALVKIPHSGVHRAASAEPSCSTVRSTKLACYPNCAARTTAGLHDQRLVLVRVAAIVATWWRPDTVTAKFFLPGTKRIFVLGGVGKTGSEAATEILGIR